MAISFLRKTTKRFFIITTSMIAFFYLLACLVPYLDLSVWWMTGFLAIGFPYLAILLFFCMLFWLIIKPKYAIPFFVIFLVGFKQLQVVMAINRTSAAYRTEVQPNQIRIANWNIRSFEGLVSRDKKRFIRNDVTDCIQGTKADVICLQEFNHSYTKGQQSNNLALFTKIYPYYYFARDFKKGNGVYVSGSIIFSKYPIVDSGKVVFPGRYSESIIYADIFNGNDTIRIYTTHLQSFRFNRADYEGMEQIRQSKEEAIDASVGLVQKMKAAFIKRGQQANIVRETIDESPYPSIICGDFNDVPNSYTYAHIKGNNRKDVFLSKGLGIGRTYIALAPTLRIDYIMPDNRFTIHQMDMVDEDLSDHIMLVADISLKK